MKQTEPFVLTPSYRRYALALFLLVYIINFVDRQIFSILIEPIRAEIELSDTQLGLLGGIAFAIFYTFAGIPIARWADVGVRKNIVALAMVIWSAMTMFTATAKGFGGLLIARIGVGVGEAARIGRLRLEIDSSHACLSHGPPSPAAPVLRSRAVARPSSGRVVSRSITRALVATALTGRL